jgi:hypothetical protein
MILCVKGFWPQNVLCGVNVCRVIIVFITDVVFSESSNPSPPTGNFLTGQFMSKKPDLLCVSNIISKDPCHICRDSLYCRKRRDYEK